MDYLSKTEDSEDSEDFEEFRVKYSNLKSWIEDNLGKYEDDESKELIVAFFKTLYEKVGSLQLMNNNVERISVMVLDCFFYSLLSDFREDICKLTTKIYQDENYAEKNPVLIKNIKNNVKKWYVKKCFEIYSLSTSLYHDFRIKDKIKEIKQEIIDMIPKDKIVLREVMNQVLTYLELYSVSKTKNIRGEQIILFDKYKYSSNPYLVGGYINLALKNMQEENAIFNIKKHINHLMNLNNSGKFSKVNEGYYFLILARYNLIFKNNQNAIILCRQALISTNSYCPRNGQRRADINNFKEKVISQIELKEEMEKLEKIKERIDEYKEEVYKLVGILLPAIVIPISVLIAFLEINDAQKDLELVLTLVKCIIFSVMGVSVFILMIPFFSRFLQAIPIERFLNPKLKRVNKGREK